MCPGSSHDCLRALAHPCAVRSSLPPASGSEGCCPQICKQQPGYRKGCCFPGSQNAAMRIRVLLSLLRTQTLTSRQGKLKKQCYGRSTVCASLAWSESLGAHPCTSTTVFAPRPTSA